VDDPTDQYSGSSKSSGLYTANTWCDEYNTADGRDNTATFRYTKNQYENNIDRRISYLFTLRPGKYSVEMCFSDPWNCSASPSVYTNYDTDNAECIMKDCITDGKTVSKAEASPNSQGKLKLDIVSQDKAININYIIIRELESYPLPTVTATASPQPTNPGDANCDGEIDMSDAVLIMQALANPNKYGIGGTDKDALTQQGYANADVDTGSKGLTTGDALRIQQYLLHMISSFE
jgi:hypothetical protein